MRRSMDTAVKVDTRAVGIKEDAEDKRRWKEMISCSDL